MDKSTTQRFSPEQRLRKPEAFLAVFQAKQQFARGGFRIHYKNNGLDKARLGISVAKKQIRRAVERNYYKRVVRESFRRTPLQGVDVVVVVRQAVSELQQQELRQCLEQIWQHLANLAPE